MRFEDVIEKKVMNAYWLERLVFCIVIVWTLLVYLYMTKLSVFITPYGRYAACNFFQLLL